MVGMEQTQSEQATETVTLMVNPELLLQMLDTWSPPVQVRVVRSSATPTGWDMEIIGLDLPNEAGR